MKKYAILTFALILATCTYAQHQNISIRGKQHTLNQVSQATIIKAMGPDLLPYPPAILPSNGKRYLKVITVNKGNTSSKFCYLKVTYQWKFDYELFTQKTLIKEYPIQAIAPSQATSVIFQVPDQQISSNPPYGSTYVSIKLEVDGTNLVIESNEKNNQKLLSLPIVN